MEKELFVDSFGGVFEHSPWVAEKAWECLPFQSRKELLQSMKTVVEAADESLRLHLLRAHPDLGSRLAMSEASKKEQAGVGLHQLSMEEYSTFIALNQRYVETFGFPFIIAVKEQTKETILAAMKERVEYPYEDECVTAVNEVYKIAGFRLQDLID
nr:2-oxo-4-hydroxy-4-carboxy-5-ureidoimidazoline decarboxylase [Neobacillus jeddahensis]